MMDDSHLMTGRLLAVAYIPEPSSHVNSMLLPEDAHAEDEEIFTGQKLIHKL